MRCCNCGCVMVEQWGNFHLCRSCDIAVIRGHGFTFGDIVSFKRRSAAFFNALDDELGVKSEPVFELQVPNRAFRPFRR